MDLEPKIENFPETKFVLEKKIPLRRSILWQLVQSYYNASTIDAWTSNVVPSFVTSNSKIAHSYSTFILGFLQDWFSNPSNPKRPVVIIEIGSGHGRFSFLLLRHLCRFKDLFIKMGLPKIPFKFILTDFIQKNVDYCKNKKEFEEFVEGGFMDFAVFDGNKGGDFVCESGAKIGSGEAVITICNYVMDSLLTDAYRVVDGKLYQALLSVYSTQDESADTANPDIIQRMSLIWDWEEINIESNGEGNRVDYVDSDPAMKAVLENYLKIAGSKSMTFVLPISGMALFKRMSDWTLNSNSLVIMIGDKAFPSSDEFFGLSHPHIGIHGTISFMVNLHAFKQYTEECGGFTLCTPYRDTFQFTALLKCEGGRESFPRVVMALEDKVADFLPDNLISLQKHLQLLARENQEIDLKNIFSLLRMSFHDPDVFWNFRKNIANQSLLKICGIRKQKDLEWDLKKVFENWYKLREDDDLPHQLGIVAMRLQKLELAIEFFKRSVLDKSVSTYETTLINLASCLKAVGNFKEARENTDKLLAIRPDYGPGRTLHNILNMIENPMNIGVVAFGRWTAEEIIPVLSRDQRAKIKNIITNEQSIDEINKHLISKNYSKSVEYQPDDISIGDVENFKELLKDENIHGVVVEGRTVAQTIELVELALKANKHVFSRNPIVLTMTDSFNIVNMYKQLSDNVHWHVSESFRNEDAFQHANMLITKFGMPVSISLLGLTNVQEGSETIQESLMLSLMRLICAVRSILGSYLLEISASISNPPQTDSNSSSMTLSGHCVLSPNINSNFLLSRQSSSNNTSVTVRCPQVRFISAVSSAYIIISSAHHHYCHHQITSIVSSYNVYR
eukprot:GHVL01033691.1.p1 GENE.GHVL01033691.1~~GHVL01033691.1.p1  ORF type:complete len:846 (+),score=120.62 GHVL01033691.1:55-2592(+)